MAAGNEGQQECTFTQKDRDLTGSCSSDRGTVEISAGKVDGKNVTWTCKGDSTGGTATLVYKGAGKPPALSRVTHACAFPQNGG